MLFIEKEINIGIQKAQDMFQNQQMMLLELLKNYQNIMQEVCKFSKNKNKKSLVQPKRLQARNKKEENQRKTFNKFKSPKFQER